jgi:hypothetical protein
MNLNNLKAANRIIEQIAKNNKYISPISIDDYDLFRSFFDKQAHSYGNSWVYITQRMYGVGLNNLGYKFYDGNNLSAICVYPKIEEPEVNAFYWVRPMGKNIVDKIGKFSKLLLSKYQMPVYIAKLFKDNYDSLLYQGFKDVSEYPWAKVSPAEDDTYPEIIIDIEKTLDYKSVKRNLRLALKKYKKSYKTIYVEGVNNGAGRDRAWEVAGKFFKQKLISLEHNLSNKYDYHNIIYNKIKKNNHLFIIKNEEEDLGMFNVSIIDNNYACSYASLALREKIPSLGDFSVINICDFLKNKGVKYLNVGGSELEGLDKFKRKFVTYKTNKMYWAVLI